MQDTQKNVSTMYNFWMLNLVAREKNRQALKD